jgi:hypothetical protein
MRKSMVTKYVPVTWRILGLSVISALVLLVGVSVTPQARTASAEDVKTVKAKRSSPEKPAPVKAGKGCVPAPGTEAYRKLMTPTSPTAPPPPVKYVGMASDEFLAEDTQWCWKQSCEHNAWTCSQGVTEDVNGCCVRCCWEGTSNCSESRCCGSRLE